MQRVLPTLAAAAMVFAAQAAPARPKLVVAIVVDQFRYDYLTRFRSDYHAGFARLLDHGAVFTNAFYDHAPTVTAIGHSTVLTGATPSISGIIGNDWYDRESGRKVTSVSDDSTTLLGGSGHGSSPRRLTVSTVGDELKMANVGPAKVIGISIKDRAAILPSGRMADGAYWFDAKTGNFVSSTFYRPALPDWVQRYNQSRPADRYLGSTWKAVGAKPGAESFAVLAKVPGPDFYKELEATPFGNDLIERFAEAAIESENLGGDGGTDLLTVSFSANDYVGHRYGPDSPQVRDVSLVTDAVLGRLLDYIDRKVGLQNSIVVFTADHGVAPVPELMRQRRMPGERIPERALTEAVETALSAKFGTGKWIVGFTGPSPYFNRQLIQQKGVSEADVQKVAAEAARTVPGIYRVYTRDQLMRGETLNDMVDRRVQHGFHAQRGADLFVVAQPFDFFAEGDTTGTSHGAPFNYDTHVPLVFMGPGVKPGRYHRNVLVNDLAPTLATLLDIQMPSGSVGRALDEMLLP